RHGDVTANIVLVIAGQYGLDRSSWASYEGLLARLPLEPFTEEEARDCLGRKGITDERVVRVILRLSERLPLLMATLAAESPDDPEKVGELSGEAVEQFLNWAGASQRRQVALKAALPRLLNRDVLAVLVGEEEADACFAWLEGVPFVKKRGDGWAYHDVVRTQMVRYTRQESPKRWADLHGWLAEYHEGLRDSLGLEEQVGRKDETWRGYALEALYHRLCQSPRKQLTAALNGFLAAWETQRSLARRWAEVVGDAGEDANARSLQQWGERLMEGLRAYDQDSYEPAAEMFTALLKYRGIEKRWRPIVLGQRGLAYLLMARNEEALADFDRAIELKADNAWAIAHRGETYRQMGQYEEALTCFNWATRLDAEYTWAIVLRGEIHRQMGSYEAALKDFDRAIELEPRNAWIVVLQGETYRQMGQYEETLACFNQAIELDPEYAWAIALRGETYQQLGRDEEALRDFDRVVELKEKALADFGQTVRLKRDCAWALTQRGRAYLQAGRYGEALADFDQAVKLKDDDAEAIAHWGETYWQMGEYEKGLGDFDRAIGLRGNYTWAIVRRGETYRQMDRYREALADFDRAINLEPENVWIIVLRGQAYRQMERYKEALADFDQAIDLKHDYAWAFIHRGKTYRQMERYKEALADFDQAIDLEPDDAQARTMRDALQELLEETEG
ncbi:MAG: tetratricopeptide repeat protein, partial [Anaerolineae bacterium]|nr:tetratricopeptide repeat protein [Anaerolineae bacterium]